ncbi:hypothetical protein ACIP2X_21280 [Streptomyces sp. NPDC089424]|uniref:hypothetical protein n=1 Tax=Streptomyces sp. NPDC089424 TaxID=3365917 RepID=UPI00380F8914
MAHAAPAPGAPTTRLPDVFSARTHLIARWAWPAGLGLVYGYWAAANRRDAGPITGWNLLFGFLTALVFVLAYIGVREIAKRLHRGAHALLWAAFAAVAFGFLYSQTDYSVLRSAMLSLVVGGVFFLTLFYRYYTHEPASRPEPSKAVDHRVAAGPPSRT